MVFRSKLEEKYGTSSKADVPCSYFEEDLNKLYEPWLNNPDALPLHDEIDAESLRWILEQALIAAKQIQKRQRELAGVPDSISDTSREVLYLLHKHYSYHDKREDLCVTYPAEVVGLVCLLAIMSGIRSITGLCDYWILNHPILRVLIPNMPHPKHCISVETVRTVLTMLPPEEMTEMFSAYFSVLNKEEIPSALQRNFRKTVAFDGQEIKASFRKGEYSRRKKGGISVSAYDCDSKRVIGFEVTKAKGNEHNAIASMLPSLKVYQDAIFSADAINTKQNVFEVFNELGFEYMAPVKANRKVLFEAIKLAFERALKAETLSCSSTDVQSGRIQKRTVSIIPSPVLPGSDDWLSRTKTLIRYETSTQRVLKTNTAEAQKPVCQVKYYVCSLPCTQDSLEQIDHSIKTYWSIEVHHNTLDTVFMQDRLNIRDEHHLYARVGYNKMVYNILSYHREKVKKLKGKTVTFTSMVNWCKYPQAALKYVANFFAAGAPESNIQPKSLPLAVKGIQSYPDCDE